MNEQVGLRGKAWFTVLTGGDTPNSGDPHSVLATTAAVGNESALFLCVVPDKDGRFPFASLFIRLDLEECANRNIVLGWELRAHVRLLRVQ